MIKKTLQLGVFIFALFITVLLIPAAASANAVKDITQEGLDFLTDPPTETTVYTAGDGTVTYEPAQNGQNAVITLENATINGKQTAYYQGQNKASAAILTAGNVDMVLQGKNTITVTNNETHGLFCFNGNMNVKGSGSLTIDIQAELNGHPGIHVLCGQGAAEDMGNFTISGGNIALILSQKEHFSYGLSAYKDITVEESSLSIENGSCAVVSTGGNINIRNAFISCSDFNDKGIYAPNGDIAVEGENTELKITSLKDEPYAVGIYAEGLKGSSDISISGGVIDISVGQSGICTDGGGNIMVSGGRISTKAENNDIEGSAVGLWATGKVDIIGGTLYASGMAGTGVGIYSDVSVSVSGGDVTAKGSSQAVSHVPDMGEYTDPVITAATDFEGNLKEDFIAEEFEKYRYLHIAPKDRQYTISYENGRATINAAKDTEAVVIFKAYDSSDRLIDLEVKETSLFEGENIIETENFTPGEGSIKIMIWDSMGNMSPLCGSEIF